MSGGGALLVTAANSAWRWDSNLSVDFCTLAMAKVLLSRRGPGETLMHGADNAVTVRETDLFISYRIENAVHHHRFKIPRAYVTASDRGDAVCVLDQDSFDYMGHVYYELLPLLRELIAWMTRLPPLYDPPGGDTMDEKQRLSGIRALLDDHGWAVAPNTHDSDVIVYIQNADGADPSSVTKITFAFQWAYGYLAMWREGVDDPVLVRKFDDIFKVISTWYPHINIVPGATLTNKRLAADIRESISALETRREGRAEELLRLGKLVSVLHTRHEVNDVHINAQVISYLTRLCSEGSEFSQDAYFLVVQTAVAVIRRKRTSVSKFLEYFNDMYNASEPNANLFELLDLLTRAKTVAVLMSKSGAIHNLLGTFHDLSVQLWPDRAARPLGDQVDVVAALPQDQVVLIMRNRLDKSHGGGMTDQDGASPWISATGESSGPVPGRPSLVHGSADLEIERLVDGITPRPEVNPLDFEVTSDGSPPRALTSGRSSKSSGRQRHAQAVAESEGGDSGHTPGGTFRDELGGDPDSSHSSFGEDAFKAGFQSRPARRATLAAMESLALEDPAHAALMGITDDLAAARDGGGAISGEQTMMDRLHFLGRQVGESYVATDLTALVLHKRAHEQMTDGGPNLKRFSMVPLRILPGTSGRRRNESQFRIKTHILRILDNMFSHTNALRSWRRPLNLVFGELLAVYSDPELESYVNYRSQLFRVLRHSARDAEHSHMSGMLSRMGGGVEALEMKRRQADLVLFRISSQLAAMEDTGFANVGRTVMYLDILRDYMKECTTRVMPQQAVETCMDSLIELKNHVFRGGPLSLDDLPLIPMLSGFLEVVDEICVQNTHTPLDDFLTTFFVRKDNWALIKEYADDILMNGRWHEAIIAAYTIDGERSTGEEALLRFRAVVTRHYRVIAAMISRQQSFDSTASHPRGLNQRPGAEQTAEDLRKHHQTMLHGFKFLVHPIASHLVRYFNEPRLNTVRNRPLLSEMLGLLETLGSCPDQPFYKNAMFVDTYISLHWVDFIKHYHSPSLDLDTLAACKQHLDCLLRFAEHKNGLIRNKFYQLRVLEFLAREIDVETRLMAEHGADHTAGDADLYHGDRPRQSNRNGKGDPWAASLARGGSIGADGRPGGSGGSINATRTDGADSSSELFDSSSEYSFLSHAGTDSSFGATVTNQSSSKFVPGLLLPSAITVDGHEVSGQGTVFVSGKRSKSTTARSALRTASSNGTLGTPRAASGGLTAMAAMSTAPSSGRGMDLFSVEGGATTAQQQQRAEEMGRFTRDRDSRKLYHDVDLHIRVIELIFLLVLTEEDTLDERYVSQFPAVDREVNVPFLLQTHLNDRDNQHLFPKLCTDIRAKSPAAFRLLKLIWCGLFRPYFFEDPEVVGYGAYGTVYRMRHVTTGQDFAIKLMEKPRTTEDRCVLHDLFTEVLIMDRHKDDARICHMLDYGVTKDHYYVVMKCYTMSLKAWRREQKSELFFRYPLYLKVFAEVLRVCAFLEDRGVLHFDIKCDNFLVAAKNPDATRADLIDVPNGNLGDELLFNLVITDFGVSTIGEKTYRGRGTDVIKSPEMINLASNGDSAASDGERGDGAGAASDVWSLGCLLYELLTNEFLFTFSAGDIFSELYHTLTNTSVDLLPDDKLKAVLKNELIIDFLRGVLVRDPAERPTLAEMTNMFDLVLRRADEKWAHLRMSGRRADVGDEFDDSIDIDKMKDLWSNVAIVQPVKTLPAKITQHDFDYYVNAVSEITPQVFISTAVAVRQPRKLEAIGITHLVNCTEEAMTVLRLQGKHFPLADEARQPLMLHVEPMVAFVSAAIRDRGKVLFFSARGMSRSCALVMAFLMRTRFLSCFEALTYVRQYRLTCDPNQYFLKQLQEYGAIIGAGRDTFRDHVNYRCLCGANVYSTLEGFDNRFFDNPRLCACSLTDVHKDCPHVSCTALIDEMRTLYSFDTDGILWGSTFSDDFVEYERNNVAFNPLSDVSELHRADAPSKAWQLFRCKTCRYVTHARRHGKDNVALVCNIRINDLCDVDQLSDMRARDFYLDRIKL